MAIGSVIVKFDYVTMGHAFPAKEIKDPLTDNQPVRWGQPEVVPSGVADHLEPLEFNTPNNRGVECFHSMRSSTATISPRNLRPEIVAIADGPFMLTALIKGSQAP